ncbi:hypothetical protein CDL12_10913 [Handroanthus impetiginosus]|uniref:Uncharacterized protein n=1 Tax=Handroanthus impetiginosus TaxID=429701 RepID=A0A2G9HFZ4_9LAMI|nr:hypothetical protein CDL12_10913 [Handroanthus impetiginosus]
MAKLGLKPLTLLAFLLFLFSFVLFLNEARPLGNIEPQKYIIEGDIMKILEDLYYEAVKTGGPSHGGDGHGKINALTLGWIKKSGPSPRVANQFDH